MAKAKKEGNGKIRRAIALGSTAMMVVPDDIELVTVGRGFKLSVNGLDVDGEPSMDACEKVGVHLRVAEKGSPFGIGDFINYVEERFGEDAAQIIDAGAGWSEKTIAVYRWVSKRIAKERRRMDRLTIKHHLMVAALTPAKQTQWLTAAANEEGEPWTTGKLSQELKDGEADLPPVLWVLVKVTSEDDQTALMAALESQGRTVKAIQKRAPKQKEPA